MMTGSILAITPIFVMTIYFNLALVTITYFDLAINSTVTSSLP